MKIVDLSSSNTNNWTVRWEFHVCNTAHDRQFRLFTVYYNHPLCWFYAIFTLANIHVYHRLKYTFSGISKHRKYNMSDTPKSTCPLVNKGTKVVCPELWTIFVTFQNWQQAQPLHTVIGQVCRGEKVSRIWTSLSVCTSEWNTMDALRQRLQLCAIIPIWKIIASRFSLWQQTVWPECGRSEQLSTP